MWTSITTSLAVTGAGLDATAVERSLAFARAAADRPGVSVHQGPGWWALTVDERCSADPGEQIAAFADLVSPHLDSIGALIGLGCHAQVAVSGTVGTGPAALTVSPESAARLASLALPVSFTTLLPDNTPAEDPLDWLG
ncbi:hypothetical protein ACIGO8_25950 [Streptomyces sp. NPDC053493]|uniref:hypothetical protein n=1 Tax=Streptomyces sp. NPDC053493 TaxID=3365705 RepID=UPI0037D88C48